MTAPHEPHDPTADELGSTAQFRAFVQRNDEPDEARERRSADPDQSRAASAEDDRVRADSDRAAEDTDDREIQFSEPTGSGPPVQSLRPDVEIPPAELGSTAQFRAFASGDNAGNADRPNAAGAPPARSEPERTQRPAPPEAARTDGPAAPALPPADPNNKRNLLVSLAVILLVVVAVVLLFVLV